jgi:hypothetical protein
LDNPTAEKQQLFEAVYQYARQNFNYCMEQNGNLSPKDYVDIWRRTIPLDTYYANGIKQQQPALKDLPEQFKSSWQRQIKDRSLSADHWGQTIGVRVKLLQKTETGKERCVTSII